MPRTKTETLAFKVDPDLERRLEDAAKLTGLSKSALALAAVEAAINAIERHGGRIVLPIRFDVSDVPVNFVEARKNSARALEGILAAEADRRGMMR